MTMEGKALRSIVLVQAKTYFGLTNLVYNLRRVVFWQTRPFQASSEKSSKPSSPIIVYVSISGKRVILLYF